MSNRPKVLHKIAGRSLLAHALAAVQEAGADDIAVVIGPGREDVGGEAVKAAPLAGVFVQAERRGTAHAVLAARELQRRVRRHSRYIRRYSAALVATLLAMRSRLESADLVALGFEPADPTGYGRLIRRMGCSSRSASTRTRAGQRRLPACAMPDRSR